MTTTMKRIRLRLFSGAILCGILQNGQAALNAVDPGPYTEIPASSRTGTRIPRR